MYSVCHDNMARRCKRPPVVPAGAVPEREPGERLQHFW